MTGGDKDLYIEKLEKIEAMAGRGMYVDQRAVGRRQRRGGAGLHRQATYSTSVYEREQHFQ